MKILGWAAVLLTITAGHSVAQESGGKADPRAVAACQTDGAAFTTISKCVPAAHIAFALFDAFDEIYPPEAAPLKERCIQLNDGKGMNDGVIGAPICIQKAIEDALSLSSALPAGSEIADPVFLALSDQGDFEELLKRRDEARRVFPEFTGSAVMYMPYE